MPEQLITRRRVLRPPPERDIPQLVCEIGHDIIQRQTQGQVVPESFTHGSSAQRVRWFKTGFESGDIRTCDTFRAGRL